jgi:hypothetical protein
MLCGSTSLRSNGILAVPYADSIPPIPSIISHYAALTSFLPYMALKVVKRTTIL